MSENMKKVDHDYAMELEKWWSKTITGGYEQPKAQSQFAEISRKSWNGVNIEQLLDIIFAERIEFGDNRYMQGMEDGKKYMLEQYDFPDEESLEEEIAENNKKSEELTDHLRRGENVFIGERSNPLTDNDYYEWEDWCNSVAPPDVPCSRERFIEVMPVSTHQKLLEIAQLQGTIGGFLQGFDEGQDGLEMNIETNTTYQGLKKRLAKLSTEIIERRK